MRAAFCAIGSALLLAGCGQQGGALSRDDFTPEQWAAIDRSAAQTLFWTAEEKRANFGRMEQILPGNIVPAAAEPRLLARNALEDARALDALMAEQDFVGLMLIEDGAVRYERYDAPLTPQTRWAGFSLAKPMLGVLAGAALADGDLASLDTSVASLMPELSDVAAYDGVTVRHLLAMASGVRFNAPPGDPDSDGIAHWSVTARTGGLPEAQLEFLKQRERQEMPGTASRYKSADSALLALIVERAVGRSLADYAREKIVGPAGLADGLFWASNAPGQSVGDCCVSMTMADYARFGVWIAEGLPDGEGGSIWTESYRDMALTPAFLDANGAGYGLHWDLTPTRIFHRGSFGQGIHIRRDAEVVLVHLSAWDEGVQMETRRAVSNFLDRYVEKR